MRRAALLALLCVGCGTRYGKRVPSELVERLPYETRIDLLEAENDLAVAYDKVDEAQNEIDRTRAAIRRAKRDVNAADDAADDAKDAPTREVAKLAEQEAQARLDYLRARQELNAEDRDVEDLALTCAKARFELARLDAAQKAKVEGAESLDRKAFDGQVKACDQDLARRRDDEKPAKANLDKVQAGWEMRKQALAQKTFDARASPYVE